MSTINRDATIFIGIGNCGRGDDGLGWAFLDKLAQTNYQGHLIYRYQLNIEDAELISPFKHVIFVDAFAEDLPKGFQFVKVTAENSYAVSSHRMNPEMIMYLSKELYNTSCDGYKMLISGNCWGLKEGLSPEAEENLEKAWLSMQSILLANSAEVK